MLEVNFENNSQLVLHMIESRLKAGAEAAGATMERHAKDNLKNFKHNGKIGYIDTGRAKNSITYTFTGAGDKSHTYSTDTTGESTTENVKNVDGDIMNDGKLVIYVGSNVYYFPYLEQGTSKLKPSHALQEAIANHEQEYKNIFQDALKNF